ncbi:DUF1080 domain-containing protein [Luteolibacter arcticus]|uniref:DUF1080 domain-containing protein n=1 Tax=Luteolibacter arcticus TaxID=1581411 RepID=A0ABT3GLP4_9BACT|nr:DUF1080 domain-containing protein [Luteolibacter arcticus]MCW1924445.1 DUF1080 domain-containing protein [Luteolibacter arcticus]
MKRILSAAIALTGLSLASAEPLLKPDLSDIVVKGPKECWTFTDGVLTGKSIPEKKGSNLWTKREFKDFTLKGEFKFTGRIDSGVFLRAEGDQIQIGISGSLKRDMTCSPYIAKTGKYPKEADVKDLLKEGAWNTFTITAKGNQYLVSLNGKQVMDYTSETAVEKGPIGLQVHPGVEMTIEFRNLEVEPLVEVK